MTQRHMALGAFFHPTGHHLAAWRHPGAQIDAGTNIDHYLDLARQAERGKFDFIFLADALACRHGNLDALSHWPQYMAYFEPTTLLAAMAVVTRHIGLVGTATTSFNQPWDIARRYASLDHLSKGRIGWNIVTSSNQAEAQNFSLDRHFDHADRYRRAEEFVQVAKGLWDSWEDDAFLRDRDSGRYFDPEKLHRLDHEGEHFRVRGPLNVARGPQGHPVLVQAGSSEAGRGFAARHAEIVFTAQTDIDEARAFRLEMRERLAREGRDPEAIRILPGLNPVLGSTSAEAHALRDGLAAMIPVALGLEALAPILPEVDLSGCDPDQPCPLHLLAADTNASKSGLETFRAQTLAGRTLRQIYTDYINARGQNSICGTAAEVADHMEHWFREGAVDGFLIQPPILPLGLEAFVDGVIPELQKRGLFRADYASNTLRENLSLARPVNRYTAAGIRNLDPRL